MARISRDPADLVGQLIGASHQYPDGAALFLGTMFAPVADRDAPGKGFTHKPGDVVAVSADKLGRLTNRMRHCQDCPPWDFGVGRLMRNLAASRLDLRRRTGQHSKHFEGDMNEIHKNYIAGEWLEGESATRNVNPSDTNDVVGFYAQAERRSARRRGRRGQGGVPGLVAHVAAGAPRHSLARLDRDRGAARGTRPAAGARRRQDASRGDRRSRPRRADLRLLRRRGAPHSRREIRQRAAGRRHRGDARGGRRRRNHRAVEFSHRHSRLEDRAGALLWQLRRLQAGRSRAGLGPRARRNHRSRRRAQGRVQSRHGPRLGGRSGDARSPPRRRRSPSPARSRRGARSRPPARARCASSSSKWAARIRSSCSTTPISRRRSNARSTARISRPASAAPRPRG